MSVFTKEAQAKVAAAVAQLEEVTAAEIVVAVRARAATYAAIDVAFGALSAFVALNVLLFHPRAFSVALMPLDVVIAFAIGFVVCRRAPRLKRLFIRKPVTLAAARAAFVELGVSRTRGRTGVLIYATALERDVAIVCDIGVDEAVFAAALPSLRAAIHDVDAFTAALLALRPALSQALPRAHDDVDELPNVAY